MSGIKILMIGEQSEFLVNGTIQVLENRGYSLSVIDPHAGTLQDLGEASLDDFALCLLFADHPEKVIQTIGKRTRLTDHFELRICLVGEKNDLNKLSAFLTEECIDGIIMKPVDAISVANVVTNVISGKVGRKGFVGRSILLMSFDQSLLFGIQRRLKTTYRIYAASNFSTASAVLSRLKMDLIILDYDMYGALPNAYDLFHVDNEKAPRVPLMVLLNHNDIVEIAKATLLKPVDYLFKSMTAAELNKTIRQYFITGKINDRYTSIPYVEAPADHTKSHPHQ